MDIASTLRVVDGHRLPGRPGVTEGQELRGLVGTEIPTDRIRVAMASYEPGTVEALHWHPIEAFYFITAGHAIVRDIEGTETEAGPGHFVYAPPGIGGAHEWKAVDNLELLSVRAIVESSRKLQFTVDKETLRSYVDVSDLVRRDAIEFPSHY
ncbi:MAG: cupin domain-containing protein [Acidimicrobiia bacterium]